MASLYTSKRLILAVASKRSNALGYGARIHFAKHRFDTGVPTSTALHRCCWRRGSRARQRSSDEDEQVGCVCAKEYCLQPRKQRTQPARDRPCDGGRLLPHVLVRDVGGRWAVALLVGTCRDDHRSSASYTSQEEMAAYTLPEMLRVPLDETVLQIKVGGTSDGAQTSLVACARCWIWAPCGISSGVPSTRRPRKAFPTPWPCSRTCKFVDCILREIVFCGRHC